MARTPADILREGIDLHAARNAEYGNNYLHIGPILSACFPDGLTLHTPEEFNRFHLFIMVLVKLTRYVENWKKNGHEDSTRDAMVYLAMLGALDDNDRHQSG